MWVKILSLFASLFEMWSKLSDETKDRIINSVVDAFSDVFRKQYKDSQDGETA